MYSMEELPRWAQKLILDTNISMVDNKTCRMVKFSRVTRANLEQNYAVPMHEKSSIKVKKKLIPMG